MSLINISNLTFAYDGGLENIFENVSFQIDTDWKLGFTGRNGRGKTTFLNLLLGKYEYAGNLSAAVDFDYFPFASADESSCTLDVVSSAAGNFDDWQLSRELSLLNVAEDVLERPFNTLSHGEQTKVLLACLFLKENNFLLIDEPTNHLDSDARMTVSNYLRSKKGFILVSHDREFLDNCIDHILSINKTNIEIQRGNFSSWWLNKQRQDSFELSQNAKLKQEIKKLSKAAERTSTWSDKVEKSKNSPLASGLSADKGFIGHKAAKMMKRSKSMERRKLAAVDNKSQLLKNLERSDELSVKPLVHHTDRLVEFDNVSIFYGEKTVCKGISFSINTGDRIALTGKNGSGKSSIMKLLAGENIAHNGTVNIASRLIVSYVSQSTGHMSGSLKNYAKNKNIDESLFKAILNKLDFSKLQFEKDIRDFSEGQKKKVLIAGSLCEQAHLYVWDEPLNFIDIFSRMQMEELIRRYEPTMLFVEHDNAFVREMATKTIAL